MDDLYSRYKNWQYKNTFLLLCSLVLLYYLADTHIARDFISNIGSIGYFGAFIVGILFVSIFTVAPAIIVLYSLASTLNPLAVAVLAGLGAVIGDLIIFKFFKDKVFAEIKPIFEKIGWSHFLGRIFRTPFFSWLIPIFGAAVIASPLPDELGITILGISKVKTWQFILIAFLLNAVGIFIVVTIARSF